MDFMYAFCSALRAEEKHRDSRFFFLPFREAHGLGNIVVRPAMWIDISKIVSNSISGGISQ